MTATVTATDSLRALLDTLQPPCEVNTDTGQPCGDPAAWIITWTARLPPRRDHGPMLWCVAHMAGLVEHRRHCAACRVAWDVRAVEL